MAVGAIGSTIYTNQMTANASSVQNAHNNRVELQNVMAQASVLEKEEKVLEVRPTEENHGVDPDKEHQKEESDEELKRKNFEKKQCEDESESEIPKVHKLDIKV